MTEKKTETAVVQANLGRRSFIKKAMIGAVFAVPVIESLTKSDILIKSALAQSGPIVPGVTVAVIELTGTGSGNVSPPPPIGADLGDDVTVSFMAEEGSCITLLTDNGVPVTLPPFSTSFDYTINNIQIDHVLQVEFNLCNGD